VNNRFASVLSERDCEITIVFKDGESTKLVRHHREPQYKLSYLVWGANIAFDILEWIFYGELPKEK
jgi:hypothetical protein